MKTDDPRQQLHNRLSLLSSEKKALLYRALLGRNGGAPDIGEASIDAKFSAKRTDGPAPHYDLRPADARDAAFIYELRVLTMRDYVSNVPGWSHELQQAFYLDFDLQQHQIIVVEGTMAGALSAIERPGEIYFANMHFIPGMQRRGLGTALMRRFIARAHELGIPLKAQVLKSNLASLRMVEKVGMVKYGETEERYLLIALPPMFSSTAE